MTQATKHTIEELPTLRLPELQAYYAEVLGETTRCPNKKFLIRRITETLAVQAERHAASSEELSQTESNLICDVVGQESADDAEPAAEPELATEPESTAETEAATEFNEPEPTADQETAPELEAVDEPGDSSSAPDATAAPSTTGDKLLTKLTVEELQQRYQDVLGRSTGSSDRRYLIWKLRKAEKGKVPVGPRKRRSSDEPAPEFKVLPLRMEAEQVERLDAARVRLGLKNRMQLFRNALNTYFAAQGENEVAALFAN